VFRSVLDLQPRMLTLALNKNLWAAYHADNGALYKVWNGNVELTGAVYDTYHGPQPVSLGDGYIVNGIKDPWSVDVGGVTELPASSFKGHRMTDGGVELMYDLELKNGNKIRVNERPEYVSSESGLHGFERIFTLENVPEGAKVNLKITVNSVAMKGQIKTNGKWNVTKETPRRKGEVSSIDVEGNLELNTSGTTRLAAYFVKIPMLANANRKSGEESVVQEIPLGQRLINKSDCKACHNPVRKTIGPSYVQIANRYEASDDNISTLSTKIIKGGSGNWGAVLMSAHPNTSKSDAEQMVEYILSLREGGNETEGTNVAINPEDYLVPEREDDQGLLPGLMVQVQQYDYDISSVDDLKLNKKPLYAGISPALTLLDADFRGLESNFGLLADGYLNIPEDGIYSFRLMSDDGSKLFINGREIINHDGFHGADIKDGRVGLKKGFHQLHIKFFQGYGGKSIIFQWKTPGAVGFKNLDIGSLSHTKAAQEKFKGYQLPFVNDIRIPGDRFALNEVHPSYDLSQARPNEFLPKVGGMDFLPDGRLVVSTWDATGGIYIIENVQSGDPKKMSVKEIASGLAEPLGLKVVDGDIYVLQKQELTRLKDLDGDDMIDEYQTISRDWRVSSNFHEFAFGLVYKEGYFYVTLATGILPGGASMNPQIPDRGKVVKISKEDGSVEFLAHGLRTPNGIGIGIDGELFVADNQGDWLPSSKIVHVKKGGWYGSRSVDFEGTANLKEDLPVVWLPQDEIGNSPSTPMALEDGIYKGQMIHGEVTHGGVKRVFVEKVDGAYQGAVFRFIQGLEGGVNRIIYGPDSALYVGCIGNPGNWAQTGKNWYGVQRLKYNNTSTFEMLAVRAKSNGVEIEFTEPLKMGDGWNKNDYEIKQWRYEPTKEYGGPKLDEKYLNIQSVNVSKDRKKVFLALDEMQANRVVYVRLKNHFVSALDHELWTTEAWYTMNAIPTGQPGFSTQNPRTAVGNNQLTEAEKAAGWKLLFDGKKIDQWRNFKKETIGAGWVIDDEAIHLDAAALSKNSKGGDIITKAAYENFEFTLEWKIGACGNSGIMFNVAESEEFNNVWETGPEMQILDNTCHPDTKYSTHRAGDLYDLIECKYVVTKPAGQWNKIRLISKNGKVEHWMNGHKVVEYEMHTDKWKDMVANSKFKNMKSFGTYKRGHLSLQDHGDQVWFRNIKIREL
ncbi:MAG: family 16 glycoside hydrolase, partial [Bacteroidota bacterium]